MKKLASVLVLLAVVGMGRADDETVIKELNETGVEFIFVRVGPNEVRPCYAIFGVARGTDALLDLKQAN